MMSTLPQNIIIHVDYSLQSENVVKFYMERLHRPGNKLILVHSIQLPELSISKARDNYMSPGILAQLWVEEEKKRKELERKLRETLQANQVPGVLRSTCGRPGEVVCRIAEEVDAAYVIIGDDLPSEGMGRVWRAVAGGTGGNLTSYLLHHVACPVILVREIGAYQQARTEDRRRRFSGGDAIHGITNRLRRIRFASGSAGTGMTTLRCTDVSAVSIGSEQCELVNEGGNGGDTSSQDPDAIFST